MFFNNQTDWQRAIDFYKDFSYERLGKVRKESIKGKQFVSIDIVFHRPTNYAGSLPQTFKVTRTWHRNTTLPSETHNLDAQENKNRLPGNLETAKRFLPQFLNKIHFEYVPAVKDRAYFEHLLSRLQKTLLDIPTSSDSNISRVAKDLADHIQNKIVNLSEDFARATQITSSVVPPTEFADLFQSFVVSTQSGDQTVPLALRGDGIQARYVSSVLQYISHNSPDFFIWGFEEPENSLEYSRTVDFANDFLENYSKDAQIFISTHSPAFTSFQAQNSTCYRVYKDKDISLITRIWPEDSDSQHKEALIEELGILKIQESLHKEFVTQNAKLKNAYSRARELETQIAEFNKPLLLVSDIFDKEILQNAWEKCYPKRKCPFMIREVDPSGGETGERIGGDAQLRQTIDSLLPVANQKAIALFDRDEPGIKEFESLSKNFVPHRSLTDVKRHRNGLAFAMLLIVPKGREKRAEIANLCIEFVFPQEALLMKTKDGKGLRFKFPELSAIMLNNNRRAGKELLAQVTLSEDYQIIESGKRIFCEEIVPGLDAGYFSEFRRLFRQIRLVFNS